MWCNIRKRLFIIGLSCFAAQARAGELSADVTAYALPNGLKVLLYPDLTASEITVNVVYKTGSKHERSGEYGMAHLLEHMLYKGVQLDTRAARLNASTNADRTSYHETLPASAANLDFALAAEAERMHRLAFTDAAIRSEMSVVQNEGEQNSNGGFIPLLKAMLEIAYPQHAYGRDTLGLDAGLLNAKPETLRQFYQRHYAPNRAVLAIGGAFAKEDAQRLIEKHFANIAAVPIDDVAAPDLAPQASEKQVTIHRVAAGPYIGILYRAMRGSDPEFVAAQALVHALGSGSQSVLQKELVRKGLAREAFGFVQQNAGEGFIAFFAKPSPGQDPQALVRTMAGLLEKAANEPVSVTDLRRFQAENTQAWAAMLRDPRNLTLQLAEYEIFGDWRLIQQEQLTASRLQLSDLQAVGRWLTRSNRTLGIQDEQANAQIRPTPRSKQPGLRMFKQ